MEILNVQDEKEYRQMLDLCMNLWEKHSLVPVVGSGFSFGTQTDNYGIVPSVKDLRAELYKYVSQYSNYDPDDLIELEKMNLSDLASSFWDIFNRIPKQKIQEFYAYISCNFQGISFFKDFQREFLSIDWPCLFTLNYDSLIENFGKKYYSVIPFEKINKYYATDKVKLFKLHGDVKRYLATGDPKYFILSRNQYVQSMMAESNKDMLDELLTAFSSKSILFFGCGLTEELDLLYSSQINLIEKAQSIDPEYQAIIYINFESDKSITEPFSQRKQDILTRYGVTTIFRFCSEEESTSFFKNLAERTSKVPQSGIESFLESYSAMQYNTLAVTDIKCRDFLFQENLVWKLISNHKILMPGYYIERSILSEAIDYISGNNLVCFISGNFFSGKTFFLLEIAHHFTTKKVYIFPAGTRLTDIQLDVLLKRDNALFCFDTKSLTTTQIKSITEEASLINLKNKESSAVIVIDKSDAPMYKYIFEARNTNREFKIFDLKSKLEKGEQDTFNQKIGAISLPPYKSKETILDYVVHNEQRLLNTATPIIHFLEPQKELLSNDSEKRVTALIMLATEIRISAKRAIQFKIDGAINDIIKCCRTPEKSSVIEKDYSVYNGDSSGYEYVCNSKYWVIRALSSFAKIEKNSIETISNAYLSIIKIYRSIYSTNDVYFYQNCEPYYFFDHIQVLFNQRWFFNSSKLMNAIYDKLLLELSNSYQFMHQKAKGKLIIAQVQLKSKNNYEANRTLTEAVFNITRAIELANQYPNAKNIQETLLHMAYTEGRIYIEYSCVDIKYVPQAVNACYKLYQMQRNFQHDIYDYATAAGDDNWAFNKFKNVLIFNPDIKNMTNLEADKVNFLLTRWTGKKVLFSKSKNIRKPTALPR